MKSTKIVVGGSLLGLSSLSQAAIDAAPVVTEIAANGAQLLLVGAAILAVVYAVRAFSWGRKV